MLKRSAPQTPTANLPDWRTDPAVASFQQRRTALEAAMPALRSRLVQLTQDEHRLDGALAAAEANALLHPETSDAVTQVRAELHAVRTELAEAERHISVQSRALAQLESEPNPPLDAARRRVSEAVRAAYAERLRTTLTAMDAAAQANAALMAVYAYAADQFSATVVGVPNRADPTDTRYRLPDIPHAANLPEPDWADLMPPAIHTEQRTVEAGWHLTGNLLKAGTKWQPKPVPQAVANYHGGYTQDALDTMFRGGVKIEHDVYEKEWREAYTETVEVGEATRYSAWRANAQAWPTPTTKTQSAHRAHRNHRILACQHARMKSSTSRRNEGA